jgi:putative membrane protein
MGETRDKEQKRILILCVDRDGDLDTKAQIKTPVVGRKANLDAAVTLALHDAEETDANAMFEAVQTYDRLTSEGKPDEVFEIATLSGSERGGIKADRKVVAELAQLLSSFPASEVILVTDGYSDEAVLPLIESRVPVTSVRRLVVKHSASIEETAAVFWRYLKMLVEEPKYSYYVLGLPGLLILISAILWLSGLISVAGVLFVFVLSAILLVKGFGVDRAAKNLYKWGKEYSPPPLRVQISGFSAIAGIICIILGVYLGWTNAAMFVASVEAPPDVGGWASIFPQISGHFIKNSINLIVVGVCVTLLGRAIRWYLERDPRLLRNAALIASVGWSRWIFDGAADVLIMPELGYGKLVLVIIVGVLIGIASFLVMLVIHRSASGFFEETGKQVEELGEG